MIRIGVLIPTRGVERKNFVNNALRMITRQTIQPTRIIVAGQEPKSNDFDITWRYRKGYADLSDGSVDLICFWEDDDWYAPDYIEYMVNEWLKHNKPQIFGTNYTIYYHLKLLKYFTFRHYGRASAMNTFVVPGQRFDWGKDNNPWTDMYLWTENNIGTREAIEPSHIISVGMKHGLGKTGGPFHTERLKRYNNEDNGFLKNTLDEESLKFYLSISKKLQHEQLYSSD